MGSGHISGRLTAYLAGSLGESERAAADAHLAGCPGCREERDLLASALGVMRPLQDREPRAGFAATVALAARDSRRPFAQWLRFSFGGLAMASAAAVAMLIATPVRPQSAEVQLAQRLDLFEDMSVMQNQAALEDLEVVEVLHQIAPEAHP
jgi:predicted anti-sigma-YlaC factor YlaD